MTVAELIEKLKEYPQNAPVYTFDGEYSDLNTPELYTKRMYTCHESQNAYFTHGYEEFPTRSYNQQQDDGSVKEIALTYTYFDGVVLNK